MITENEDITKVSNLTGEAIGMTLDEESLAHLMSVLTGLYEDPELATLREIASNARDSHVAAGIERPIEVDLPTPLACFLTIRDFGTGLDADDFRNIYSKYGASTKRESNDFVGMLGLGCKAPLAYTDQFTVVGVKNGIMTTVNVGRDEDDGGTMTIMDESSTDEPNGVTVTIPTKRYNSLESKANDLFKYWKPGTVLVNGVEPEFVTGLKITDEVMICKGGYYAEDVIVMGDVPYEIGSNNHDLGNDYNFVAFLPIGSVKPTPSREGLKDNKQKALAIEAIKQTIVDKLEDALQANVNQVETPAEAFKVAVEFSRLVPRGITLKYKSAEVPTSFSVAQDDPRFVVTHMNSRPMSRSSRERKLIAGYFCDDDYLFVHGYDRASFTPTQKKKLVKYVEDNDLNVEQFILHEDIKAIDSHWLDTSRFVSWADIDAIKLPRPVSSSNNAGARLKGSYDAYVEGSLMYEVPADDIDTTDLYYICSSGYGNYKAMCRLLAKYRPSSTIVPMATNRIEKFQRNFPNAILVTDELKDLFDVEIAPKVSECDHIARMVEDTWGLRRNLKSIDPTKIDDPELVRFIEMANEGSKMKDQIDEFNLFGFARGIKVPKIENPFDNYPLFDYNANQDHLHFYINACYAARKDS